jgi:D-alanine transfer protein
MFRVHVLSFLFALALAIVSFFIIENGKVYKDNDFTEAANYANTDNIRTMQKYLNNGRIVIFGSSELRSLDHRFIPQKFFNLELNIPLSVFGHGYHQSFSIASQLASYYNSKMKKNARLVILLSPFWFRTEGTKLQSFLEFMPEELLRKLYLNKQIDKRYKSLVSAFIRANKNGIVGSSTMITHASEYGQDQPFPFSLSNWIRSHYNELKYKYYYNRDDIQDFEKTIREEGEYVIKPDWDYLMTVGKKLERDKMMSNSYGIEDKYWKYLLDHTDGGTKLMSMGTLPAQEVNKEYEQFLQLLEVCELFDIKPLFIMQAQNPLIYHDIEKYDEILSNVKKEVEDRGFTYFNMHTSDKSKYVKGTLTDTTHTGEYGWVEMNKAIYKYFSLGGG